ncbi:MAG TPA: biotin synthase [Polaromonas sp.]|uniref:biotin synthase n=1 Tax=Polaromonas sp. TaxID=1869339 RepID=UPI002D34B11F|nr:biotin synthase [Polaromonas sp.]HYW58555.1 biotin synthase [Polaromonas sp.]
MATDRPPTIDPQAAARWQQVAPLASPWLHEEVAHRMLDRLQWIKLKPKAWADWGAVRGGLRAHRQLAAAYADASCFVVEAQELRAKNAIKKIVSPWWSPKRWVAPPVVFQSPPPATVDMLWANMALHEASDPQALLAQWHESLKVGGFVMFSCLGPDTTRELREVYHAMGWPPAGHQLTDMHDWGDMLVQTGFAEPVMDMERITLTFETAERLLLELRELGRNLHPGRFSTLRGREWKQRLIQSLEQHMPRQADGQLTLTFEIIYGHALKPQPKVKVSALSAVSVQDMRAILQGSRGGS